MFMARDKSISLHAMCYDARQHSWGVLITYSSFAQGDEWPVDGREPEEQFMFVYGTSMDDFNPVTQASPHFICPLLCLDLWLRLIELHAN